MVNKVVGAYNLGLHWWNTGEARPSHPNERLNITIAWPGNFVFVSKFGLVALSP